MKKIRGVNLGNWLVLEKWMCPEVFAGTTAGDEDTLCRQLPRKELEGRLKKHRDHFITAEDFRYLKGKGINTVRIPVPHFIFGDDDRYCEPYVPCIEYLDRAFVWAQETGMEILIDMHTAPECQNGFDNGGICGVCRWHQSTERVERLLKVLGMLAERYGHHPALWGLELLNEPIAEVGWYLTKDLFRAADPDRAAGSSFVPLDTLFDFYRRGYALLRPLLAEDKKIVFHDGFRPEPCCDFFMKEKMENVVMDVHWYLNLGETKYFSAEQDYMNYLLDSSVRKLKRMEEAVPVILGEWSLEHRMDPGISDDFLKKTLSYRMAADAQLLAWEAASGWFFWSYKLMDAPEGWCFKDCMEKGWLPDHFA